MEPREITQADLDERDEYCSPDKFKELIKQRMKKEAMGFKEAVEAICEEDPIMFLRHMLGATPFAWQFNIYKDYKQGNRTLSVCCNRQGGKTKFLVSPITLWRGMFNHGYKMNPTPRNKSKYTIDGIISLTEQQSIMVLEEIKQWIWDGDAYIAETYLDKQGKPIFGDKYLSSKINWKTSTKFNLVFKKGIGGSVAPSVIKALPATDKIRGNTFTGLIFDEVAFIEDYVIESVAIPASKAIGSSRMLISTPDKKAGHFYRSIDPDDLFERHFYNRYMYDVDCLKKDAPDYYAQVMEEVNNLLDQGKATDVNREYYCDFTSSNSAFFDMDKVEESFTPSVKQVSEFRGKVSLGIDVGGKTKSHTVLTIVTEPDYNGVSKRIACWRYPIKEDVNIIADVEREIFPNFQVHNIVIDYCAASRLLYEEMLKRGWNVTQFEFSKSSKTEYYDRFRNMISNQKLLTYPDSELKNEFVSFTDDMKPMKGATDDMLDSWMLAAYPFLNNSTSFMVKVIGGDDTQRRKGPKDNFEEQLEAYHKRADEFIGLGGAI